MAALIALPAGATPGQSLAEFDAWAHRNPTLYGISGDSQLDGTIQYAVTFVAGPSTATYTAFSDKGETTIVRESIVLAAPDDYRLDRHLVVAARLLSAVYGRSIADDFRSAAAVESSDGDPPTVAYRGKLFGYEITGARIGVRTLAQFDVDLATM